MASGDRTIRLTIVGTSDSAEKALKATGNAATQAEVKVEGFGRAFLKAGVTLEAGRMALDAFAGMLSSAVGAVGDYTSSIDLAERQLRGMLGSQEAASAALAVARSEADAGRGTYQELAGAMTGLSSVARTAGMSLQSVTEVAQILAAVNPAEGLAGATFALREAASGDMTSIIERFNLSRTTINRLRAEGVPAIEAVRRAMQEMGYDAQFLNEVNQSGANQWKLLKGELTEFAAVVGQPIMDRLAAGIRDANKAAAGDGGMSFAKLLAQDFEEALAGQWPNRMAIIFQQTLAVLADQFNNFLKLISGGKINIDSPLNAYAQSIRDDEARLRAAVEAATKPVADTLAGRAPDSALARPKIEGYGRDVVNAYIAGLTSGDISAFEQFTKQFEDLFKGADGKTDTAAFAQAQGILATALGEVASQGQITAQTFYALTATFGDNAANVIALVNNYGQMTAAQDRATASGEALAATQGRIEAATEAAERRLKPYADAVDDLTEAAQRNAESAAAAIEPLADRLDDVGEAAAASARESAAAIQALQDAAASNAAAYAAAEAAAQEELTAIQERRKREAEALYNTLVDGERRALDAANERVNQMGAKGRKEDLGLLRQIQAAEDAGDTKKAAALRRQLEAQRKRRRGEEELAAAEAAVAKDEFDQADKRADKEVEALDARIGKEEEAAKARLGQIQGAAKAQADADAAAIKGAQAAAKAEADRYAAQQRGIQAEIDRIKDAADAQAKKDAQAIKDARAVFAAQEDINTKLGTALQGLGGFSQTIAGNQKDSAAAAKEMYEWIQKVYQIYADHPPGSPGGPPRPQDVAPIMPGGVSPYDQTPPSPQGPPPSTGTGGGGGGTYNELLGVGNFRSARRDWDALVRGGSGSVG